MENTEQTEIQDQKDINTIVDTVISAIDKRTEKITRSIANDNFSKLSDDDKKAAYELLSEKRQNEANKDKKAYEELKKNYETVNQELANYKNKEKETIVYNRTKSILSRLGITDEKTITLLSDLVRQNKQSYINDDNTVKEEELKTEYEALIEKYGLSKTEKNQNIKIGAKDQKDKTSKIDESKMSFAQRMRIHTK